MDLTLLVNPTARAGAAAGIAARAVEMLHARGVEPEVVAGTTADESVRLVRAAVARGAGAVAVCGGDGTVALAVDELVGNGIPLGIIPAGTGNDIGAAAGVPVGDTRAAVDAIIAGRTRRIDLALATRTDGSSRPVCTVLASGFDSRVNDRANRMTWPRGGSRYTLAILIELLRLAPIDYDIDLELADGTRERVTEPLIMAAVCNGPTYGGGIPIAPDARTDDALLDVVLVRPVTRRRLLRLLPRVYRGTHTTLDEVSVRRVRSVRLAADGVTGYADGDAVGPLPLTIEVLPAALDVFVPNG